MLPVHFRSVPGVRRQQRHQQHYRYMICYIYLYRKPWSFNVLHRHGAFAVYLVFGASGGIGSALVEALGRGAAGGGARVVLAGLHEDKLEAVAERATAAGGGKGGEQGQQQGQCEVVTCDALKPEEVRLTRLLMCVCTAGQLCRECV